VTPNAQELLALAQQEGLVNPLVQGLEDASPKQQLQALRSAAASVLGAGM
jgi:hypothetical protein